MRRTLLACTTAVALLLALPAAGQDSKSKKRTKQSKKLASTDTDSSVAPDKVLYDRSMKDIKKGRQEIGRLTLQTLINTYPDSEFLADAKLAIADSYYKEGGSANLTQAIAAYKDFGVFFPFSPKAPYAQMQVAMTHFKQMEKPDRDRTEARAAEEEFQTFLLKYPNDPLVPQTTQHLREVQELLAEGEFRIGYYYYVKGDRRASAGRLLALTKRYPLYSKSDHALWMLGDIFEKSEKKEIAAIYLGRIVRDYPLSPLAGDAKNKLVAFGVPVPQPDPKALQWMQAEQNAVRPKPGVMSKPLSLVKTGPGKEMVVAARNGLPQMQPDTESVSLGEVLTGGGQTRMASPGGSSPAGNTAVIEVATPGSGAAGGSNVEAPAADAPATTDSDPNAAAPPTAAGADPNAPAATTTPAADATQPANGQTADAAKTDPAQPAANDKGKESTSKKKKGIKKIIPW